MRVIVARSNLLIPSKCKRQPLWRDSRALQGGARIWGVLAFLTCFYGNGGTKFPDKVQAEHCLARLVRRLRFPPDKRKCSGEHDRAGKRPS
jgi:hypothetical protein